MKKFFKGTDEERVTFQATVSKQIVDNLKNDAKKYKTTVNHLIEIGLKKILNDIELIPDAIPNPGDRIAFSTTYDKDVLEQIELIAEKKNKNIVQLIELSYKYIDYEGFES